MKKLLPLICVCSLIIVNTALRAEDVRDATVTRGEKPKESPGWLVIEDDFWFPWRYEFLNWYENAVAHNHQCEEKVATT